jgi:Na+/H+-dicarboxylate symporter
MVVGEEARPLRTLLASANAAIVRITMWVLETAPFGVFAMMAWVVGRQGLDVLVPLLKLIVCLYAACLLHMLVVSGALVGLWARLNLVRFFRGILDALLVAYSTATSNGTLPVTLRCAEQNLGVSRSTAAFVVSVGATINMDGTAIYMGLFALFTAQAFGVDLGFAQYAAIVLTGTLAAVGAAGIPSASLVLIPMVLGSAGLPAEAVALVLGVDRILDMMRTTVNVAGDAIVAVVVGKSEGALDLDVFNGRARA